MFGPLAQGFQAVPGGPHSKVLGVSLRPFTVGRGACGSCLSRLVEEEPWAPGLGPPGEQKLWWVPSIDGWAHAEHSCENELGLG